MACFKIFENFSFLSEKTKLSEQSKTGIKWGLLASGKMDENHPEIRKLDYAQKIDKFLQVAAKSIPDSQITSDLIAKAQVRTKTQFTWHKVKMSSL